MTIRITQQGSQIVIMMETETLLAIVGQLIRLAAGRPNKPVDNEVNDEEDEEQAWRRKMLARHKANYRHLQEQLATYSAGEQPLHLLNQTAIELQKIQRYSRNEEYIFHTKFCYD